MLYKKGNGIFSSLKIEIKAVYLILNSVVFLFGELAFLFLPINITILILENFREWKNLFVAIFPFAAFLNMTYLLFFLDAFGYYKIFLINLKVLSVISGFILFAYTTSLTELYSLLEKNNFPFKEVFYFCIRFLPELEREIKETLKIGLKQKANKILLLETFFVNIFNKAEDLAAAYYLRRKEQKI